MRILTKLFLAPLVVIANAGILSYAFAQTPNWPARTVTIVIPSPPGSATDLMARVIAEKLPAALGQPVIVDNKPGAATNIGHEFVARQPADGYTILVTQNTITMLSNFYKNLRYDPAADFAQVSMIATAPLLLTVNTATPIKSLKELVDYARANPKRVTYASAGVGSPHHLAMVMLGTMTGIEMTHVPYRGSAAAAQAALANEVTVGVAAVTAAVPFIKQGKIRALGVVEARRASLLPDVPTLDESYPGIVLDVWLGALVPVKTPHPIIERLSAEINKIIQDPAGKPRMLAAGLEPAGTTPERFAEVYKADLAKFAKLTKAANIQPE